LALLFPFFRRQAGPMTGLFLLLLNQHFENRRDAFEIALETHADKRVFFFLLMAEKNFPAFAFKPDFFGNFLVSLLSSLRSLAKLTAS
jgi:hypothetical protein